ncbi:hypothetical protein NV379_01165 [Paenibacillus sp. N1-5-1-14]|uniref:hypothetical protein n=1 Tax=Paenibacillus radicibacter TaxID=2972488 RepID=UPI00215943DD|nr:hypothetical protein [Paenibacillus radicibacter]MCR8641253.1 hypothetical protein [Paenibacillus radicibacter]
MNNDHATLTQSRTIPIFYCLYELDDHLEFYTAMGFEINYYQKAPYRFASVRSDFAEISFYTDKHFEIGKKEGGCYISVPNVEEVYEKVKTSLKKYYGKVPIKGLGRISKLNMTVEDRRFNITDPSGNYLIVGTPIKDSQTSYNEETENLKTLSAFEKLYKQAYRFAYSKEDYRAARNLLESALLKHHKQVSNELLFKAKVLQLDVAVMMEQKDTAKEIIKAIQAIELTAHEESKVGAERERLAQIQDEWIE